MKDIDRRDLELTAEELRLLDWLAKEDTSACGECERERLAAHHIRMRLLDGEFDADLAESEAWAESEEGQAAMNELIRKPQP